MSWHYGAVYDAENEVWEIKEIYHFDDRLKGQIAWADAEPQGDTIDELIADLEAMLADVKRHRYHLDGDTLKEASHAGLDEIVANDQRMGLE